MTSQLNLFTSDIVLHQSVLLRDYQIAAVEKVLAAHRCKQNVLLYAPTGAGKTEIAIALIKEVADKDNPVIFVVNREELVNQFVARCKKYSLQVGIIQGGKKYTDECTCYVLSIDSLKNRLKLVEKLTPTMVIVDEAHSHVNMRAYPLYSLYQPKGILVGLSASPFPNGKMDKKLPQYWLGDKAKPTYLVNSEGEKNSYPRSLGYIFDTLVQAASPSELKSMGYLVDSKIINFDIDFLKTKMRLLENDYKNSQMDFTMGDSARIFNDQILLDHLLEQYKNYGRDEYGNYRQAAAFACTREHANSIAELFKANDINTAVVDCDTPRHERDRIFDAYQRKKIKCIASVDVIREGFDMPCIEVLLHARPTRFLSVLIQMWGRGLRPYPGKTECIILDQADSSRLIRSDNLANEYSFDPFAELNFSNVLAINPPAPPQDRKNNGDSIPGPVRRCVILDNGHEMLSSDCQAVHYMYYFSQQKQWNTDYIMYKFFTEIRFPSRKACALIGELIGKKELKSESDFNEWVDNLHARTICFSKALAGVFDSNQEISQETRLKIRETIKALNRQDNLNLKKHDFKINLDPPNDNFLPQLQAARKISADLAKSVYRKLSIALHPDTSRDPNAPTKMQRLNAAWDFLKGHYKKINF